MTISEATEAAGAIIDRYPNGGRGAGDRYIGALASVLLSFPRRVALRCADFPVKPGARLGGVCAAAKFLPAPAELVEWCDRESETLRREAEYQQRVEAQRAERQTPYRRGRLSYGELKNKYGDWRSELDERASVQSAPSDDELRAIYGTRRELTDEKR